MKTRRIIAIILAMLITLMMVGCSDGNTIGDNGITNELKYRNYDFWTKNNEIRLSEEIVINYTEGIEKTPGFQQDKDSQLAEDIKLTDNQVIRIQELKEGITTFLLQNYQVDVSEKLAEQEIKIFEATGMWEYTLMGYVDSENPKVIKLNKVLLGASPNFFDSIYIHETLHQLGIRSTEYSQLDEGIADALMDMICYSMGITPVLSDDYWACRTVAYQILAADPEIVSCYLKGEGFNILDRVDEKLDSVTQPYVKVKDVSQMLEDTLQILNGILTGQLNVSEEEMYEVAFLAQEIVRAYCQECEPDKETIAYIRQHYMLEDYESIVISNEEGDYVIR